MFGVVSPRSALMGVGLMAFVAFLAVPHLAHAEATARRDHVRAMAIHVVRPMKKRSTPSPLLKVADEFAPATSATAGRSR